MKAKIGGLIFIFWLILGVFGFFIFFNKKSISPMNKVSYSLSTLDKTKTDATEWMSHLKKLMAQETSLAAIFITNNEGTLASSIYESNRLSREKYLEIVKNFNQINKVRLPHTLKLMKINDIGNGNSVYLVAKSKLSYLEIYKRMKARQPAWRWFIAGYFLIASLLLLFIIFAFFFDQGADKSVFIANSKPFIKTETKANIKTANKKIKKSVKKEIIKTANEPMLAESTSDKSLLLQNQLIKVLDEFCQTIPFEMITFYVFENQKWMSLLQKKGQLYIRGESLRKIPAALASITDPAGWQKPLRDPSRESLLLPVKRRNSLFGAFFFQLKKGHQLPEEIEGMLMQKAAEFSRAIFIQKTYEKAIIDDETSAFTYPYFYFAIKERILAHNTFAVLIFDLSPTDMITAKALHKWILKINAMLEDLQHDFSERGLLSQSQRRHIIARIENNRFAILFDLNQVDFDLSQAEECSFEVRRITDSIFSSRVSLYGSLVSRDEDINNADEYIQRLQYSLKVALENKTFGTSLDSRIAGIL